MSLAGENMNYEFVLVDVAACCGTWCDFHVDAAFCPAYLHLVHLFVWFFCYSNLSYLKSKTYMFIMTATRYKESP